MSKDDNEETALKSTSLASIRGSNINEEVQEKRGISGTGRMAEEHTLRAARLGIDFQDKLGLTGMASKIAAIGLAENNALRAARLGMDFQDKLGLTGMASKIAAIGLAENHALKAARLGMDFQDKLGLIGMASKIAAIGLAENHALKAARLGIDIQDKLGLTGMASKIAAMGLTENHALKAARLGMDFQDKLGLTGMASKIAAMGLHYNTLIGKVTIPEFQTAVKEMLASPVVEKAFSHLINENDFEATATKLCSDNASMTTASYDTFSVEPIEIVPFDPTKTFLEWYENLNPIGKHAITAVFAIILSIIANLLTPSVEDLIRNHKRETKAIIKAYRNSCNDNLQIDNNYRFVSATRLHVREKPRTDSAIIATATLGKVVSVDYKKKSWAKISYYDDSNRLVIGWVLLRYVSNFKK